MPFVEGKSGSPEKVFKEGESGNPSGRPRGARNRSTVVKEMLSIVADMRVIDDKSADELKKYGIESKSDLENLITAAQVMKAIAGDTKAYQALMDSGYGAPKNQIETSGDTVIRVVHEEKPKPEE